MSTNPLTNLPLKTVLDRLSSAASQPFETATPIPGEINHSVAFLEHERSTIFLQEWICVGRADEIANHGDYLTDEIAGVPLFVIRQKDGEIAAFVNACAHRRAQLLGKSEGSAKRIVCPYHAWSYDCAGTLLKAPYMEMKEDFDPKSHSLNSLHCSTWQGFIYVSLSEKPKSNLPDALRPLTDNVVGRYGMEDFKTVIRETMAWNGNWKNLVENYIESYHVPMAHQKTFANHGKPLEDYICGEDSDYYCYHRAPQESDTGLGAAHPDNHRLEGEWRRMMIDFCVFPCHLVTLMPDYVWYISVQPDGTDKFKAFWGVAIPPEVLADIKETEFDRWRNEFTDYINVANEEDRLLVEALSQGSKSPMLPVGTYNPIERNLWQFTRYLAKHCCSQGSVH